VKPHKSALAALLLTATVATPCAAQHVPSTLQTRPGEICAGCFAYLEFPPSLEPERFAGESSAVIVRPDQSPAPATLADPAGPVRCPGALVDVTAASREERGLVCSAATDAIRLLGRCGITLRRPLHVQIMSEVRHPVGGKIFGLLDTKRERVLVTQEASIPSLVKDTPYANLPQRDFYRSLIVHEAIHGIMHQNLKRPATTHAAYEYPAYALQIESLSPHVRDTFLQSFDRTAIAGKSLFNDPVLFFDPYFFAASAYHHFKASADGCAHLTALLHGEVAFIAPPQM
jgi:hypothetical protein